MPISPSDLISCQEKADAPIIQQLEHYIEDRLRREFSRGDSVNIRRPDLLNQKAAGSVLQRHIDKALDLFTAVGWAITKETYEAGDQRDSYNEAMYVFTERKTNYVQERPRKEFT